MTRDPFLRLALIAACSLYVVGLDLVAYWLGSWAAVFAGLFGAIFALALTLVLERDTPSLDLRRRHRQPAEGTKGFERVG